jgi:hypothetical protein
VAVDEQTARELALEADAQELIDLMETELGITLRGVDNTRPLRALGPLIVARNKRLTDALRMYRTA